jgi:hypothetical protein
MGDVGEESPSPVLKADASRPELNQEVADFDRMLEAILLVIMPNA